MALLTPVSLDEARALGASFGLRVAAARGIPAGSVNTNIALELEDGGRAFLRVYEEQTIATARHEAALLDHLAARGVKTPRPLSRVDGDGFIGELATAKGPKPVAVFPWVAGEIVCQKSVTPAVAREVGEALAEVHLAGASYADPPRSRFTIQDLDARLASLRTRALSPELTSAVAHLSTRLARHASRGPFANDAGGSTWGLVHGDLFRDNVLWQDGHISALLDFESASRESRPFDLMVTALAFCFGDRLEIELVRAMLQGYARVRPLSEDELDALPDEGSFAATRFAITRITDFELRPRGSGVYKDYRRFLARAEALDALGPRGLRDLAGLADDRRAAPGASRR